MVKVYQTENFVLKEPEEYIPKTTRVKDAALIPATRKAVVYGYEGGIYNSQGHEVVQGQLQRCPPYRRKPVLSLSKKLRSRYRPQSIMHGDFVYLGGFSWHYGHFLLEGLTRIPLDREKRISYSYIHHNLYLSNRRNIPHVEYFLKALGIKSTPILSRASVHGNVWIPRPRMILKSYFDKSQCKIYEEIRDYALQDMDENTTYPKMIYLSRSRLQKNKRKIDNEHVLETRLSKRGFKIIHMQELPISEQIKLVSHAEVIVGFSGSAMHSLLFSNIDTKAIILYDDKINDNFVRVDKMLGRSTYYIDISGIISHHRSHIQNITKLVDIICSNDIECDNEKVSTA